MANPFEECLEEFEIKDIIEEVLAEDGFDNCAKYLSFLDTGVNEAGKYLLYSPNYSGNIDEDEKISY